MYKMDEKTLQAQSNQAYRQWCVQWREHAKIHSEFEMKPFWDFENVGIGKAVLLIGNGHSFEENLELIKENQHNVDVFACDKTLGHCLDNGIKPKYVLVCDANVSYESYMEQWKDELEDTYLFINVCANPKWSQNGNWKGIYFFANEDVINSEKEFMSLSGCPNKIPAATNVSNAMVVLLTQCSNEKGRANFFGYDKIILIGFDYCWLPDKKYYAFDRDGGGKFYYMRHITLLTAGHKPCFTSTNLMFSANWLEKYVTVFQLPVVQGSKDTITRKIRHSSLGNQLLYRHRPEDAATVKKLLNNKNQMTLSIKEIDEKLKQMWKDHNQANLASII